MEMTHGRSTASRTARRTPVCICLAALCLLASSPRAFAQAAVLPYAPISNSLTLSETPLQSITGSALPQAGTPYVDGISDQSLPGWDGYFTDFFQTEWRDSFSSHITLARYVVQWNVMSGNYPEYRTELESWYADVLKIGLIPELSLASYDGVLPGSVAEYRAGLEELLNRFTAVRYVEAWDEPNVTPTLTADTAAQYTNEAYSLCQNRNCTVIAGNLLDSPNMVMYEKEYERWLDTAGLSNWGMHPYYAVKDRKVSTALEFEENLPNGGVGEKMWFTEVGAYRCEDEGRYEPFGEREQAIDASWLVNRLMPAIRPVHVFYYELLFEDRRPPPCRGSDSDTALYVPSGDPNAPDAPRAAANFIYDDQGTPSAYTGTAAAAATATGARAGAGPGHVMLTASIYPGGFQIASYHFEYGSTAGYGSYSPEGDAGAGLGRVAVSIGVGPLQAGTTYHYRVIAWNGEGAAYGADRTFTMPAASATG
jgi:hypothetical protein